MGYQAIERALKFPQRDDPGSVRLAGIYVVALDVRSWPDRDGWSVVLCRSTLSGH
jgi:hypothetical protein